MVEFRPAGLGVWFWVGFGAFVPFSTICPRGKKPLSTDPIPGSVCHPSPISSAAHLCRRSNHKTGTMEWSHCLKSLASSWISHPQQPGCRACKNIALPFLSWSQMAIFCPAHFQSCNFDQLASSPSSARRLGRPIDWFCRSTARAIQS